MDPQQREILRKWRVELVDNINIQDGLLTQLLSRNVLTSRTVNIIKKNKSPEEQVEEMLDMLQKQDCFDTFCEALIANGQEHIVKKFLTRAKRHVEVIDPVTPSATTSSNTASVQVVNPWGAIIAQCSEDTGVCVAELDLDYLDRVRSEMPVQHHRRTDLYGRVTALESQTSTIPPDESSTYHFGQIKVTSNQVFYRTALSFAVVNIKPVVPGHVLVIPLRVTAEYSDLSPAEITDLFLTAQRVARVVKKHFGASSSTIAMQDGPDSGQTVRHVHVHVLPRKQGDFKENDDVYNQLESHDKGWTASTKLRSQEEMSEEATQLRRYFYQS